MSVTGSCDTVSCQLQCWCCYLHRLGLFVVQEDRIVFCDVGSSSRLTSLGLLLLCIAYDYHTSFENVTQLVSKFGSFLI